MAWLFILSVFMSRRWSSTRVVKHKGDGGVSCLVG